MKINNIKLYLTASEYYNSINKKARDILTRNELSRMKIASLVVNDYWENNIAINKKVDLDVFLDKCCHGLNVTKEAVKEGLLNDNNMSDIKAGEIPVETVIAHVRLWSEVII